MHTARFLGERGTVLVGAADSRGAIQDPNGLDVDKLMAWKRTGQSVAKYPEGEALPSEAVIDVECDIWIPAARPDVINETNAHRLKTKLVVQGANIPVTVGAEEHLHARGVLCVPDFIANAGGVICAAMEYQRASQTTAFEAIEEKLRHNTARVLEDANQKGILPRAAAIELAVQQVKKAMSIRRWVLFSAHAGSL
jgi:glutamate dehydrogenase (NAD(P)+)